MKGVSPASSGSLQAARFIVESWHSQRRKFQGVSKPVLINMTISTFHTLKFDSLLHPERQSEVARRKVNGRSWHLKLLFLLPSCSTQHTVSFPIAFRQQRLLLNNVSAASPQPLTPPYLLSPTLRRKASLTMSSAAALRRIVPRLCSSNSCLNIRRPILKTYNATSR